MAGPALNIQAGAAKASLAGFQNPEQSRSARTLGARLTRAPRRSLDVSGPAEVAAAGAGAGGCPSRYRAHQGAEAAGQLDQPGARIVCRRFVVVVVVKIWGEGGGGEGGG